jgi:phosphoribosylformylglycinamidine synthase
MKMGIFGPMTLAANSPHGFQDRWIGLKVEDSNCHWTKGLAGEEIFLPIRHGEGRIWAPSAERAYCLSGLRDNKQIVLRYEGDPNGSLDQIAGLCDTTGQVLGLMPHPEAALMAELVPVKAHQSKTALHGKLFQNALQFVQENHR